MAVSRVSADSNRSKMAERFAISKNLTAEGVAVPELVKKKARSFLVDSASLSSKLNTSRDVISTKSSTIHELQNKFRCQDHQILRKFNSEKSAEIPQQKSLKV